MPSAYSGLISKHWNEKVIFIGCSGCREVMKQAQMMYEFNVLQNGQVNILAFFDQDKKDNYFECEFARFSSRFEIENFLYDSEVLVGAFDYKSDIDNSDKTKDLKKIMDNNKMKEIKKSKNNVTKKEFNNECFEYIKSNEELQKRFAIELHNCIFNPPTNS
jgi:ATP-dependent exoDNAse (exonuclease V) alpha subunit